MSPAAQRLREAIEAFWRGRGQVELSWLRHGTIEAPRRSAAAFLFSDEGQEALQSSELVSELPPAERSALAEQRALIAAELQGLQARPLLQRLQSAELSVGSQTLSTPQLVAAMLRGESEPTRQLEARSLSDSLDAACSALLDAKSRSDDAFLAQLPKPPELSPLRELAARVLSATDDAAQDLTRRAVRSLAASGELSWPTLLAALRRPELDALASPKRRAFRLAEGLRRLGFERDLNQRMRAETAPGLLFPVVRLAVLSVPHDVRVALPVLDYGVTSELCVSESIGRALAAILISPVLPAELRWPLPSCAGAALGSTYAQLRADPLYLRRSEGLSPREAEALARHGALVLLLRVRSEAALLLSAAAPARNDAERLDHLVSNLRRALGVQLAPGLAALLWLGTGPLTQDLAARMCGLGVHVGLRERFDVDWFHNPRASEPLRGACTRGNGLSVEAFCKELDVSMDDGCKRLLELLA